MTEDQKPRTTLEVSLPCSSVGEAYDTGATVRMEWGVEVDANDLAVAAINILGELLGREPESRHAHQ